jgi:hypothetical protein
MKEMLLRDNKLILESALSVCRANERSAIHLKDLHSEKATAAAVFKKSKDREYRKQSTIRKKHVGQDGIEGVIGKVDKLTEWVNCIVCAEKSNGNLGYVQTHDTSTRQSSENTTSYSPLRKLLHVLD